jgi:hypothetical protein
MLNEKSKFQPQARERGEKEGFEIGVVKTSFKANTKALAENEGDGLAKVTHTHSYLVAFFLTVCCFEMVLLSFHLCFCKS